MGVGYVNQRLYGSASGPKKGQKANWSGLAAVGNDAKKSGSSPNFSSDAKKALSNAYINDSAIRSNSLQAYAPGRAKTGPNAKFNSDRAAAKDAAKYIGQKSIENDWEYGAYIYSWTEKVDVGFGIVIDVKYYAYTEPHTDKKEHSIGMDFDPIVPKGKFVAGFHTHGAYKKGYRNEVFSEYSRSNDKKWAKAAQNGEGAKLYLLNSIRHTESVYPPKRW